MTQLYTGTEFQSCKYCGGLPVSEVDMSYHLCGPMINSLFKGNALEGKIMKVNKKKQTMERNGK
ncbi:hypothetical protein HYT23_01120 [Candidatus Pacearchaeota archaeon]|nr:hypothetical protein [Candidatus Pacearchaeota archaeon]